MSSHHRAGPLLSLLTALAAVAAGCGATTPTPSQGSAQVAAISPWPTAADYGTIRAAVAVRDTELFHPTNWRRKAFAASMALRMLLTVRMAAGSCAAYTAELYGNLRDLMDAYPGEDWRPLQRLVKAEPALVIACRRPPPLPAFSQGWDFRGGTALKAPGTPVV